MKLPKKYAAASTGPWAILPEEVDRDYIRIRGTQLGGRYKIANVTTPIYETPYKATKERDAAETRANALLISDAPRLAAAVVTDRETLRAVSGFLLDTHPDEHNDGLFHCGCERTLMYRKVMNALEATKEWEV